MSKLRVLFCSEYSELKSGFSKIYKEIISRLYNTQKYDIAELAAYAKINDPRSQNIPWKLYCNSIGQGDPNYSSYQSNPTNVFGAFRFERTLLDFKPDVIIDFKDYQMMTYHNKMSPLRKYYHRIIGPATDCDDIRPEWLEDLLDADAIVGYTQYSLDTIKKAIPDANFVGVVSPAVDTDIFKPVESKKLHRIKHGIKPDADIILFNSRNQPRKLIPDLIHAFQQYVIQDKNSKAYLYLHTSFPDKNPHDLPFILKNNKLINRILFTYICRNCGCWFPSTFKDAITTCKKCKQNSAIFPNVEVGVTEHQLAEIYNLADIYIQYANSEGFGMGQIEAAACGNYVMAVDYSAMSEVMSNIEGQHIEVQRYVYDQQQTGCYRAYPDNKDTVNKISKYFSLNDQYKVNSSKILRENTIKHYSWDKSAKTLMDYLDNIKLTGSQGKWNEPYQYKQPNIRTPSGLTNSQFVEWAYKNILNEPERAYTLEGRQILQFLNYGKRKVNTNLIPFSRDDVVKLLLNRWESKHNCEMGRIGQAQLINDDFIHYANHR